MTYEREYAIIKYDPVVLRCSRSRTPRPSHVRLHHDITNSFDYSISSYLLSPAFRANCQRSSISTSDCHISLRRAKPPFRQHGTGGIGEALVLSHPLSRAHAD